LPLIRPIDPGNDVEQRRLPRPRRPHESDEPPRHDVHRNRPQRLHIVRPPDVMPRHPTNGHQWNGGIRLQHRPNPTEDTAAPPSQADLPANAEFSFIRNANSGAANISSNIAAAVYVSH